MRLLNRVVLGFGVGLLAAGIVALACHLIRFRPDPFTALGALGTREALIHDAHDDPFLASLPQDVAVRNDNGIGFRRIEIRCKSGAPGLMRYHYLTSLGWPQPIFSTGSQWLGRYRESDSPSLDWNEWFSAKVLTGGSSTVFHWSGILFDALTFGLPICTAAVWLRGTTRWPGVVVRRVLTTTAIAWWLGLAIPALGVFDYVYCATGSRTPKGILPEISSTSLGICSLVGERPNFVAWRKLTINVMNPMEFARQAGSDPIPLPAAGSKYRGREVCGFAMSVRTQAYLKPVQDHPDWEHPLVAGESMSAGWPLEAFNIGDSTHPIVPVSDLSHLDVQWVLWLANVSVLSAGLAVFCFILEFLRRRSRVAPGHCAGCGYQVKDATTCPECGRAIALLTKK